MRLATTRDALRLTGLSTDQLREWTTRRALIPADIKSKGHGSSAQFSWQTILLLRLAVTLRDRFKLDLQSNQLLFNCLSHALKGVSFLSLWDRNLLLHGGAEWAFSSTTALLDIKDDLIVLKLNPHLKVLADGFSLPQPQSPVQLPLFSPASVNHSIGK